MINQTTEYALRAIVYLAENMSAPHTIQEISAACQAPAGYMAKVVQDLGRAGLVVAQRGPGGGITLARPAEEITLYDVVYVVEPIDRIVRCPLGRPEHTAQLCPLHKRLDETARLVEEAYRATTVAEVADVGTPIQRASGSTT